MKKAKKNIGTMLSWRSLGILGVATSIWCSDVHAAPPPAGTAPILKPTGGMGIDGDLLPGAPLAGSGDWVASPAGTDGVIKADGSVIDSTRTFHFTDSYIGNDNIFSGGLKWTDNPNLWTYTSGKPSSKTEINNVLVHLASDSDGHLWTALAADRASTSGDSYIDFEFLQKPLYLTNNNAFFSAGSEGGRTVNDVLLSLAFTSGGKVADFYAWRWQETAPGVYAYVDVTASLPANRVFVALNAAEVSVPYGAFGQNTYAPNAFAEAAIDMTALLGNLNPCLSLGIRTILVKTKASSSSSASIEDFITPIQYDLQVGPAAKAGADQSLCAQGAETTFSLKGSYATGMYPVTSSAWTVVSGNATIESPNSLETAVKITSGTATLRLTINQANGCTASDDVVLTVKPLPAVTVQGPSAGCPNAELSFSVSETLDAYNWTITGNGTISGSATGRTVKVLAGAACDQTFTLAVTGIKDGCSTSEQIVVTVADKESPVLTIPADATLECPAITTVAALGVATATDNCGQVSVSHQDAVVPGCGASQTISRTWTAIDTCGNTTTAVQNIIVRDSRKPSLKVPADAIVECPGNTDPAATGLATGSDECGSVSISHSDLVTENCGNTKVIARTWVATDACGNTESGIQTITVRDTTKPTLTIPENKTLSCPADISVAALGTATGSDTCGEVTITHSDKETAACGNTFTVERTWTATDECGNSTSQVQTIAVVDRTAPMLTIPADLDLECPADTSTNATGVATATDECGSVTIKYTDAVAGDCGVSKVITRTWTATDDCGNSVSDVQTITLKDTGAPSLVIPNDVTLDCPADTRPEATGFATSEDLCGSATVTYKDVETDACGSTKTIARTWIATDACGNKTERTQTITVRDIAKPTITVPPSAELECPADTSVAANGSATAQDTCGQVTITHSDKTTPGCGSTEIIVRTWTATDECGNSISEIQTITVKDTTKPALTVPADITLELPQQATTAAAGQATATDKCGDATVSFKDAVVAGCGNSKTITRTWEAKDACGNVSTANQIIKLVDTTAPVLTLPASVTLECPADISVTKNGTATATDLGGSVTVTHADTIKNECGGSKTITRTWTATDACGNIATGVQTLTVRDTVAPILTLPADATLECPAETGIAATGKATATDECSQVTVTHADEFTAGCAGSKTIVRTWTATDECGNVATGVQTITVRDTKAPTLTIPSHAILECPSEATPAITGTATATDLCGTVTVSHTDVVTAGCGNTKTIARTWTAIDECGNKTSMVQNIKVQDTIKPTLTIPPSVTLECPADISVAANGQAIAEDICGSATVSFKDTVTAKCGNSKVIARVWTATDSCGNQTSATQTITVQDTVKPIITIPVDVTMECSGSTAPSSTGTATATDTCGTATVKYADVVTPICGNSRLITRTWTASDACGNTATGVQKITIQDTTAPEIACYVVNTISQGGYGGGGAPAELLEAYFTKVFTNGLTIGIFDPSNGNNVPNGLRWEATAAGLAALREAVRDGGGSSDTIARDAVNPIDNQGGSSLARQTITLTLNIGFNAAGVLGAGPNNFGQLVYTKAGDSLSGKTVSEILQAANRALAGFAVPAGYDLSKLASLVNDCNMAFHSYTISSFAQQYLGTPMVVVDCASKVPAPNRALVSASDSCSSPVTVTSMPDEITNYIGANRYTIIRTWVATDACGNTASCAQTILVNDIVAPALAIPGNLTLECSASIDPSATGTANGSDNCLGQVAISYTDSVKEDCTTGTVISRTWTATDDSGNSTNRVQFITLKDTTKPTLTVPADLVLEVPAMPTTDLTGVATATDACSTATVTFTDSVLPGCGLSRVIKRTWKAADLCGNSVTGVQTITVQDTTRPMLTAPADITLACPANTTVQSTGNASATDASGTVKLTFVDVTTAGCGGSYIVKRTWTAEDLCGNKSSALQTITVNDTTKPVLTLPADIVLEVPAQPTTAVAGQATATDTCSTATVTFVDSETAACGNSKTIRRTWKAVDPCGNESTGVQTITIADTTKPTLTLPANVTLTCPADTSVAATGSASATDAGGTVKITSSDITVDQAGTAYVVKRTWTAEDLCGNKSTGVQTITVNDTQAPVLSGLAAKEVELGSTWSFDEPTATDNCSTPVVQIVSTVTNYFPNSVEFTAIRTWEALDKAGNRAEFQQTVTAINPVDAPIISSQPQSQIVAVNGSTKLEVTATGPGTVTYQWQFNGTLIEGATSSTLALTNLQLTNAGMYSVIVANEGGQTISAAAALNVAPMVTMQNSPNGLVINWPEGYMLQTAPTPSGPYTDMIGAVSPLLVDVTVAQQAYFRLRSAPFSVETKVLTGNAREVTVTGPAGINFVLQTSSDMVNWNELTTGTAKFVYTDTAAAQTPLRYYRAVPVPVTLQIRNP